MYSIDDYANVHTHTHTGDSTVVKHTHTDIMGYSNYQTNIYRCEVQQHVQVGDDSGQSI